jgi:hypothetical protein
VSELKNVSSSNLLGGWQCAGLATAGWYMIMSRPEVNCDRMRMPKKQVADSATSSWKEGAATTAVYAN